MSLQPAPHSDPTPPAVEKHGDDARQGVTSGRVITVLIVSLILAVVAMVVVYKIYF